jgi:hypothetical protein
MTALARALYLTAGAAALAGIVAAQGRPPAPAPRGSSTEAETAELAALQEFQSRLGKYLTLRSSLAGKLGPLASTADARQLTATQEALAAAIRTARATAKRGELIPPQAARVIVREVRADFTRRNPTVRMGVYQEVPASRGASLINKTYPASDALPTMPPLLLGKLPKLPDNLQYRFARRDVVILDGDVQVVIDYIPGVLPVPLPEH